MSDRFRAGEPLSASKLNRNSASTNSVAFSGPGSFAKTGSSFGSVQADTTVENFWVAIDEAHGEQVPNEFGSGRVLYRHSWTEVTFDPARGAWRRVSSNRGHWSVDPVYHYNPTQQITLSGDGEQIGSSSELFLTKVYPVARDPQTGYLFFFS